MKKQYLTEKVPWLVYTAELFSLFGIIDPVLGQVSVFC